MNKLIADLAALITPATAVTVWSRGGVGLLAGGTVVSADADTVCVFKTSDGGTTIEWASQDIAGFATTAS